MLYSLLNDIQEVPPQNHTNDLRLAAEQWFDSTSVFLLRKGKLQMVVSGKEITHCCPFKYKKQKYKKKKEQQTNIIKATIMEKIWVACLF